MKAQIDVKNINDLKSYGLDIEDEISKLLSEEIAKSIDVEIMKSLFDDKKDKINKILEKISKFNEQTR